MPGTAAGLAGALWAELGELTLSRPRARLAASAARAAPGTADHPATIKASTVGIRDQTPRDRKMVGGDGLEPPTLSV